MNERPSPPTPKSQFSLRSLFVATTLIALVFGISQWLGPIYGWFTAIPLTIGLPLHLSRPNTWRGALGGFLVFALIGKFCLIGWSHEDPQYIPTVVTIGAYGSTLGAAVHAFFLQKKLLAVITGVGTLIAFWIVLNS